MFIFENNREIETLREFVKECRGVLDEIELTILDCELGVLDRDEKPVPDLSFLMRRVREVIENTKLVGDDPLLPQKMAEQVSKRTSTLEIANRKLKREISIRREITKKLLESEMRFRILSNMADVGIVLHDRGTVVECNSRFCEMVEATAEEIIGVNICSAIPETCRDQVENVLDKNIEKPYDIEILSKTGREIPVQVTGKNQSFNGKSLRLATITDLTQRKEMERKELERERLIEAQSKFAAMGEMIGAIAHQWRQPLSTVSAILQNIVDANKFGELSGSYLEECEFEARKQVEFMSKTIDDFRGFFKSSDERELFDVNRAVKDAISLLVAQFKNHFITVSFNPCLLKPCIIEGFQNQFKQALINILNNAKDAILDRREKRDTQSAYGLIEIFTHQTANGVTITIQDDGGGVKEGDLERIFDPYFTTKGEGSGTGLGLYMSKTIVEKHMNGRLRAINYTCRSSGLRGARFIIEFVRRRDGS